MERSRLEARIHRASLLVAIGLLVQGLSFASGHPLAFVAFLTIGCPLAGTGIAIYLLSLTSD